MFAVLATAMALLAPAATAGDSGGENSLKLCLGAVVKGGTSEISCDYEALLTPEERGDMQRLSRGLLADASCIVNIRIARPLVEAALKEADHVFEAPPQPVTCKIVTKNGGFPITSTFAPRVVFKGGLAVEATPGMGAVTGINRYLAWPLIQYVNRSKGIRDDMLTMINVFRPMLAKEIAK